MVTLAYDVMGGCCRDVRRGWLCHRMEIRALLFAHRIHILLKIRRAPLTLRRQLERPSTFRHGAVAYSRITRKIDDGERHLGARRKRPRVL